MKHTPRKENKVADAISYCFFIMVPVTKAPLDYSSLFPLYAFDLESSKPFGACFLSPIKG